MTIFETTTVLSPAQVVELGCAFSSRVRSPHAPFPERMGANHLRLHLEVGEVVIGAFAEVGVTRVRGSASRGAGLLSRFLATLPAQPPGLVQGSRHRLPRAA